MSQRSRILTDAQKPFGKLFDQACARHNAWEIWESFVTMSAISISNVVDKDHAEQRAQEYLRIAKKYSSDELDCLGGMLAELTKQLEMEPYQDFLGDIYLRLEMNDHWKGQFFTPYNVCRMTAEMVCGDDIRNISEQGKWTVVNDPACGAGAMLIAFAEACKKREVNYQTSVLFVGQDIDPIVGYMCYLQLSLLGCPGYVVIGDSLANPARSIDGRALIPDPRQNVWYTPFYFHEDWCIRRQTFFLTELVKEVFRKDALPQEEQAEEKLIAVAEEAPPHEMEWSETNTGQLMFL